MVNTHSLGKYPETNLKDLTYRLFILQGEQQMRIRYTTNFPIHQKYKPEYIRTSSKCWKKVTT